MSTPKSAPPSASKKVQWASDVEGGSSSSGSSPPKDCDSQQKEKEDNSASKKSAPRRKRVVTPTTVCQCEGEDDGCMMSCFNEDCSIKLWHLECIPDEYPNYDEDDWLCPICQEDKDTKAAEEAEARKKAAEEIFDPSPANGTPRGPRGDVYGLQYWQDEVSAPNVVRYQYAEENDAEEEG